MAGRTRTHRGVSYPLSDAHPAADEWPWMAEADLQALADDIAANGLVDEICRLPDGRILDGRNRELACRIAKVEPYYRDLDLSEAEAATFVWSANGERRHDDPEMVRRRRAERVKRVAELRSEGKSTRAIADEVGVSQPQVLADLRKAVDKGLSTEPEGGVVTGKGGKTYPATRPEPPDPDEWDAWEPEEEAATEPPPQTNTLPRPSSDASKPDRPSWWREGGKPVDPDHPFADELKKFTALAAAITTKIRTLPEEHPLRLALIEIGTHVLSPPVRFLEFGSDVIQGCEVKEGTVTFVGLRMLRSMVKKYGGASRYTPGSALKFVAKLSGEDDE